MPNKQINGECDNCESLYSVGFVTELSATEFPEFCPFCGEKIESFIEESVDDEDELTYDEEEWE